MATMRSRGQDDDGAVPPPGSLGDVVGHIGPAAPAPRTFREPTLRKVVTSPPKAREVEPERPKPAWTLVPSDSEDDDDAYDALTDLFLGEIAAPMDASARPRSSGRALDLEFPEIQTATSRATGGTAAAAANDPPRPDLGIELLILGHLPVFSSAWASQYARTVAEAEETPVALIQVRGGSVTVDLVTPPGRSGPATEASTTLEDAIRAAAARTDRWIVRTDETDEPLLSHRPSVRWLTLLTSADEAAVVGAYRAIKNLAPGEDADGGGDQAEPQGVGQSWGQWHGPAVRVALMGCGDDAGDAAYAKIAAATRAFLSRPIRRAPGAAKISSGRPGRPLFMGRHTSGGASAVIELIERSMAAPRPAEAAAAAVETERAAVATVSPKPAASASAPAAASLVRHIPGLTAVEVRCPYAGDVEFAVGTDGRLHALWMRATAAKVEQGTIGVEPILVATAWAKMNDALVRKALAVPSSEGPVGHVFVDEPKHLRGLLDTDLRVHLLASLSVGGQVGWVCRELN